MDTAVLPVNYIRPMASTVCLFISTEQHSKIYLLNLIFEDEKTAYKLTLIEVNIIYTLNPLFTHEPQPMHAFINFDLLILKATRKYTMHGEW